MMRIPCAVLAILVCFNLSAIAASNPPNATELKTEIHRAMAKGQSLKEWYATLAKEHAGQAVKPLLEIASDDKNTDETRWAALFGLARIAGRESFGVIRNFMTNSSWMLRDAALKAAAALNAKELSPSIEQRLRDDALIVRTTAVQTIGHLKLTSSAPKLVDALFDPNNFHGGKPLWIHKYILGVIRDFHYEAAVPKLVQLLETSKDEVLQSQVVQTLESLTGRKFPGKSPKEQVYLWKRNTLSEATF